MYYVSAQGVYERMINIHYYYYVDSPIDVRVTLFRSAAVSVLLTRSIAAGTKRRVTLENSLCRSDKTMCRSDKTMCQSISQCLCRSDKTMCQSISQCFILCLFTQTDIRHTQKKKKEI